MERADFAEFFLASAGVGGAFVGLLFVAISIGPQRTFGGPTITSAPRQLLAEGALVTLFNGFVVSSVALIPGAAVGWVALGMGIVGVLAAARLAWVFARYHRHKSPAHPHRRDQFRVVSVSIVAGTVFAIESMLGLMFARDPHDIEVLRGIAYTILGIYALGSLRAWTLLGDPQHGLSGWLNPLQDLPPMEALIDLVEPSTTESEPRS